MDFMAFGGIWFLFALLMQIAVLALVILGIVWLVRRLSTDASGSPSSGSRSALDELEARYARGDIDRTTYLQMQVDLQRRPPG